MRKIKPLKLSPSVAGIIGISFYLMVIFLLTFGLLAKNLHTESSGNNILADNYSVESVNSAVIEEQTKIGLPMYLKIPKINIDTVVEYVGLAPNGAVDVPKNTENAAWFNLGRRPGESGSAVIAGHYGRNNGKTSVFDNLYKLRKGDKLYIEDDKGETISFVVRESRRYNPDADASYVFSSSDNTPRLNLITCEGDWDKKSESYSSRLVIFTEKE